MFILEGHTPLISMFYAWSKGPNGWRVPDTEEHISDCQQVTSPSSERERPKSTFSSVESADPTSFQVSGFGSRLQAFFFCFFLTLEPRVR